MRTPSALQRAAVTPSAKRPHLLLVAAPVPPPRAPARHGLAALLAGLTSGFVLAAFAAVLGGGSPTAAFTAAAILGAALVAVLVRCRAVARRAKRGRAATRPRTTTAPTRMARAA